MRISIIAAMAKNRVIGVRNELPWRLPADMRRFRQITMGHPVLMGRKTHESIGKPLPGRENIVLSRNSGYSAESCVVVHDVDAAIARCAADAEVMIIGGASFYAQVLPRAARMYLTYVHHDFEGDQYFPAFDECEWRESAREDFAADETNPYSFSFVTLDRCS